MGQSWPRVVALLTCQKFSPIFISLTSFFLLAHELLCLFISIFKCSSLSNLKQVRNNKQIKKKPSFRSLFHCLICFIHFAILKVYQSINTPQLFFFHLLNSKKILLPKFIPKSKGHLPSFTAFSLLVAIYILEHSTPLVLKQWTLLDFLLYNQGMSS